MSATRRAQLVLAGVVALQLIAETSLTPYWPLMFRRLFDLEELAATGTFLAIARAVGLAALPVWGLLALRWPKRTLLIAGLVASAVFDLALAIAPSWWSFTLVAAGVMATGSVLVMAYPALIAVTEGPGGSDRRQGVVTFWVVFHGASVIATLVGALIVGLAEPRWGLAAFAVLDLALALAVWGFVPAEAPPSRDTASAGARKRRTGRAARRRQLRPWLLLVAAVIAVDAAIAVPRPYFVELLMRQGTGADAAGWLFLAPGLAALLVLPLAPRLLDVLGRATAPVAAGLGGLGLLAQAVAAAAESGPGVLAGRLLFGVGFGLLLVVLDLAIFDRISTDGPAFSAIESGRSAALFAAPLVATAATGLWVGAPLVVGAGLLLAGAALLLAARTPDDLTDPADPEETDDAVSVH